jgi:hypothetical protein
MDFLSTRGDAAIRKELIGIRDSYHHYWDLLAELLQNSRDAITRKRRGGHSGPFFIHILLDPASNTIEVMDNGSGISRELLWEMLAPGGGDKGVSPDNADEVGEKGVGLTYVVFSCNEFSVSTRTLGNQIAEGNVRNAQKWLNRIEGAEKPTFHVDDRAESPAEQMQIEGTSYPLDSFTRMRAGAIMPPDGDVNIFQMTPQQQRLLLRTRTAVGVTKSLFEDGAPEEFDVFLSVNTPTGLQTEKVEARAVAPHRLVAEGNLVTLQATRDAFVTRGEPESRRRYLKGKAVWARETVDINGWDVQVYGVMLPDNDSIRQLSESTMGVAVSDQEDAEGTALLQTGIYVGTKGMPTGMKIAPKPGAGRYPAYYKRCYFFVESPHLKFDLGRKSLHYRHVNKLQAAVASLFSRFEDVAPFQGEARIEPGCPQVTPAERRASSQRKWLDANALPDLNEAAIRYEKHPNAQEAAVAAIFHELVGASVLPAYRTVRTGYAERYDIHARHVIDGQAIEIVIEFKYVLESLVRDLSERQKHFNDIDLLIAWDADVRALASAGFHLDATATPTYQGVTHVLSVPVAGIDPIPVILLRTLLDRRRAPAH